MTIAKSKIKLNLGRINRYLKKIDKVERSPLYFVQDKVEKGEDGKRHYVTVPIEIKKSDSLVRDVAEILYLTNTHSSYERVGGRYEHQCECGANRSSLDLWRHVKVLRPKVTLPQVMEVLYELTNRVGFLFCSEVDRMVFYTFGRVNLEITTHPGAWDIERPYMTEYGIPIQEWAVLHVAEKPKGGRKIVPVKSKAVVREKPRTKERY